MPLGCQPCGRNRYHVYPIIQFTINLQNFTKKASYKIKGKHHLPLLKYNVFFGFVGG